MLKSIYKTMKKFLTLTAITIVFLFMDYKLVEFLFTAIEGSHEERILQITYSIVSLVILILLNVAIIIETSTGGKLSGLIEGLWD